MLRGQPLIRRTATTLTDMDALLQRLDTVRTRGYAVSDQENVSGVVVLAAPVFDIDGLPIAALSVAAPVWQITLQQFEAGTAAAVLQASTTLARALQATGGYASSAGK